MTDAKPQLLRALLRADRADSRLQDLLDCAELAAELNLPKQAAALYGLVILQLGTRRGVAVMTAVNARLRLWTEAVVHPVAASPSAFPADIAISQIVGFAGLGIVAPAIPTDLGQLLPAAAVPPPTLPPPLSAKIPPVASQAADILRLMPEAMLAGSGWSRDLRTLTPRLIQLAVPPLAERINADAAQLVELLVLRKLQEFVSINSDLLAAEADRVDPFEWAADLDPAALGPYFSRARLLFRTARDVFSLYDAASAAGGGAAGFESWCLIASAQLPDSMLEDLIDELGDRGMATVLTLLLARAARDVRVEKPQGLVWKIRDAAIDLGEGDLAIRAQALVVRWRWYDPNERIILGDIAATFSARTAAGAAYESVGQVASDHRQARERLAMLAAGSIKPVTHGYGSSAGRAQMRRARAAALARGA